MFPILFASDAYTLYSYGVLIMIGALLGYYYMRHTVKKDLGIAPEKIQLLAMLVIFSAFVGGKVFYYLEDLSFYLNPPSNMLIDFRTGFTFYGSLLFAFPLALWFFIKEKWPVWPMLDRLAISATIIHSFGRMGCFLAGCCFGVPTDQPWGVTFTHDHSQAPLHQSLHPTQLYSVLLIASIFVVLMMFKRHKRFEGQLFFLYILLYAFGRGVIEIFRGDLRRGLIIEGWLSHSQLISLILIMLVVWAYVRFYKKEKLSP